MSATKQRGLLHWLPRAGYAARGVIYLLVGWLAARAAWSGARPEGPEGAMKELWTSALGSTLLVVIGIGLLLFAAWRLMQALLDRDGHGTDPKGLAIRGGLLASAVTYGLLGSFAFGYLGGGEGEDSGSKQAAAYLLSQPFGRTLLGIFAFAVVGVGLAHLWKAYKKTFLKRMDLPERVKGWACAVCRFGLAMRGLTFILVGAFFVTAAIRGQSEDAAGLGEALQEVQKLSFGWVFLAVIALGLGAFGLYSLIEAAWRRVEIDDGDVARSRLGRALNPSSE